MVVLDEKVPHGSVISICFIRSRSNNCTCFPEYALMERISQGFARVQGMIGDGGIIISCGKKLLFINIFTFSLHRTS